MKAHPEPTRTREGGTEVTLAATGAERIAACRRIVARKQYAKVDGVMVDLFSASAILMVYNALSKPENRAKMEAMPIRQMASIAFKLIK